MFIKNLIKIGVFFFMIPFLQGKDAKNDSLKQVLYVAKTDSMRYILCREIGDNYYEGNFDSLLVYYEKALVLAQKLKNTREEISTLRSFAYVYKYRKNDYDKSAYYFKKTYDFTVEKKDTLAQTYVLNDLGELYRTKGENIKAVDYLFKANKNAELLQHKHLLTRTWHSIGLIYQEQEKFEKALEYFEKALPFTENEKYKRMRGTLLNSIGKVHQDVGKYQKAAPFFKDAIHLYKQLDDNDSQADVYFNMAENELAYANYSLAIQHFEKALTLNEIVQNPNRAAKILVGLANTYLLNHSYEKAKITAQKGLALINKIDTRLHSNELKEVLAKAYAKQKNYQQAYLYHTQAVLDKDSLQFKKANNKLAEMTLKYETEKKVAKIQKLETDNIAQQLQLSQSKSNNRFLIFASLLLSLLGLLWQRSQKMKHLKRYKKLRIQLTNDLHDNVSSSLNQIKIMANQLNNKKYTPEQKQANVANIKKISNDVIGNMHDLLWSLDDSKETLDDLISRMRDHASNVFVSSEIAYQIKDTITKKNVLLTAAVKNNLYSIYKEAINNVVKHAQPNKVNIHFSLEGGYFKMRIKNDTRILKEVNHSSKIGLKSIKTRAEAILGKVSIINEKDVFVVQLSVPI